jgi:L-lactate dehydrogenase complex protein LldG
LDGIAMRLKRPRVKDKPPHPFRGAPASWNAFEWSGEERIRRFAENVEGVGGHAVRLADMEEVKRFVVKKVGEHGAKRVIMQNRPELTVLDLASSLPDVQLFVWNSDPEERWIVRAAEADIGIVIADYGVAYTGSMVIRSSENQGRSISLLPEVLMAIIPADRIKTRLGEIMAMFDREKLPAGIHFITGPSRSADIENDLAIGVHGPGIVYALIVG